VPSPGEVPPTFTHWLEVLAHRHVPGDSEVVWRRHLSGAADPFERGLTIVIDSLDDDRSPVALAGDCAAHGFQPEFTGLARSSLEIVQPDLAVAVHRHGAPAELPAAPPDFRTVAIVCAYNEADVIGSTIRHLVDQGLEVVLVDNWSTDDTVDIVTENAGDRLLDVVKHPQAGPSDEWALRDMLGRVEALAVDLAPAWVIRNDADEQRWAPWAGVTLRDALYHAESCGATAVNHTLLNFQLTTDGFPDGGDPAEYLRHFEPAGVADPGERMETTGGAGRLVIYRRPHGEVS
jgi:hypothetical protein